MVDQRRFYPCGNGTVVHKIADFVNRIIYRLSRIAGSRLRTVYRCFSVSAEAFNAAKPKKSASNILAFFSLVIVMSSFFTSAGVLSQ